MKLSYHAPILFSLSLALFAVGCEPPDGTHEPGMPRDTFEEPAAGEERLDPMTPIEQPDPLEPHQPGDPQAFDPPPQPEGFESPPPTGLPAEPEGLGADRIDQPEADLPAADDGSPPTFDPERDAFDLGPPQPAEPESADEDE